MVGKYFFHFKMFDDKTNKTMIDVEICENSILAISDQIFTFLSTTEIHLERLKILESLLGDNNHKVSIAIRLDSRYVVQYILKNLELSEKE